MVSRGKPLGDPLSAARAPCRRYTVYILPHSHTDIGYTDVQPDALAKHQRYLEEGMALAARTAGLPPDARFKWNLETLYEADDWLKAATPAQAAAFVKTVKNGGLGLDALLRQRADRIVPP